MAILKGHAVDTGRAGTGRTQYGRRLPHISAADLSALTRQERRIADLTAGGLTNREIGERMHLSPRTVGSHLYRAFPKLGITSRAALRDALGKLPGTRDT